MRILFLVSDFAYPPRDGMQQQTLGLMKYLIRHHHTCQVIAYLRSLQSVELQKFCEDFPNIRILYLAQRRFSYPIHLTLALGRRSLNTLPFVKSMLSTNRFEAAILNALDSFDPHIVHFEGIGVYPYLYLVPKEKVVFNLIDSLSLHQRRLARLTKNPLAWFYRMGLFYAAMFIERRVLQCSARVHVVSQKEARYLYKLFGKAVTACGIMTPTQFYSGNYNNHRKSTTKPTILFLGDLRQPHIAKGLEWFLDDVFPAIINKIPEVNLMIVGRGAHTLKQRNLTCKMRNIIFLEWIENLDQCLLDADVIVMCDQTGTGLKNRVIHAMGMGKPIVGTPAVFEGIPIEGMDVAICHSNPEAFSDAVVTLLINPSIREKLGQKAACFVSKRYNQEVIGSCWVRMYKEVMSLHQKTPKEK